MILSFPPEIRQKIIEIVLLSSILPPLDHSTAFVSRQELPHDWTDGASGFSAWPYGPNSVRFQQLSQDFPFVSQATPLLLTNRQIREETQATIRRLGAKVETYEVDILFINEQETWPTWTCVPALTSTVKQVDATIRIFGNVTHAHRSLGRSAFTIGDGSPPQITWSFYFLLEYFLKRGPVPPCEIAGSENTGSNSIDRSVTIQILNLNFTAGDG